MQSFRIPCKGVRLIFLFTLLFFTSFDLASQDRCGHVAPTDEHFENWLSKKISLSRIRAVESSHEVYEIPIVVHVIEPASGGSLGISNERIFRQIEILNEDFRRTNADAANTPSVFQPVAADTEIQFVLAKQDPEGNPTNGIVRIRGSRDVYRSTLHQELLRSESFWPPSKYLNLYVLDLQVFLGYASFPVSDLEGVTFSNSLYRWDGVMVDFRYFGDNPDAPSFESFGRTATHEVGHYLGLRHIWGDGGCGIDDFVSDTPEADDDNGGLSSPCTFPSNDSEVCDTDEMFQNYMDYTDDGCMNLFTEGQKARMRTILESAPRRASLLTSPALNDPVKVANDLAVTKINAPEYNECDNLISPSVDIFNYGTSIVTSYDIDLLVDGSPVETINRTTNLDVNEGETVIFSDVVITSVPVDVTFTIANVNSTLDGRATNDSKSRTIANTSSSTIPFSIDFESSVDILGEIGSTCPWELVTAPNSSPTNQALRFGAFGNNEAFGEKTEIKTPVFNLTGINSAELQFSYAHANITDAFQDGLAVKVSTDCGATFSQAFVFNSYGPDLATADPSAGSFTPSDALHWADTAINVTQYANTDGIQFTFIGLNGGGNNIYLDDISLVQTNLNATDVSLISVEAPLITCKESTGIDVDVRNVGYQEITSLTFEYQVGSNPITTTVSGLSLVSGASTRIGLDLNLAGGLNDVNLVVSSVNGLEDNDLTNNSIELSINRDQYADSYPLIVDFETPNFWEISTSDENQLWRTTQIGNNHMLVADAFNSLEVGNESWFISPALDIGTLDTAGLSFKVSHAERIGTNDNLRVLMSINCGENYTFELLNAFSDSLAVAQSDQEWFPQSEADWKEFKIDLKPSIPWQDDIRIAFVFTNAGGNNLFIDDINIGYVPETLSEGSFQLFPNPSRGTFNVAFELAERDDVEIQILDISGKVIFTRTYQNVLDQVFDFDTISESGFYFVKITGKQINQIERLYIRR